MTPSASTAVPTALASLPQGQALRSHHLRALGAVPHYFGLGFIQMKVDDVHRIHVWVPDWPTIPGAESELHDHRYAFTSRVLRGTLEHECFRLGALGPPGPPSPGQLEVIEVSCKPGQSGDPAVLGLTRPEPSSAFQVHEGSAYTIDPDTFHRARALGPTVSHLARGPVVRDTARVLRPPGSPHACPFSLDVSVGRCWEKIEQVLDTVG